MPIHPTHNTTQNATHTYTHPQATTLHRSGRLIGCRCAACCGLLGACLQALLFSPFAWSFALIRWYLWRLGKLRDLRKDKIGFLWGQVIKDKGHCHLFGYSSNLLTSFRDTLAGVERKKAHILARACWWGPLGISTPCHLCDEIHLPACRDKSTYFTVSSTATAVVLAMSKYWHISGIFIDW